MTKPHTTKELSWVKHLRPKLLGRTVRRRDRFSMTDRFEADVNLEKADDNLLVYRFAITVGTTISVQNQHSQDRVKRQAVQVIAREMYREQLVLLHDLRVELIEEGYRSEDSPMRKVLDLIDMMEAREP